jgi:NitT/TauT family transport system permease protein
MKHNKLENKKLYNIYSMVTVVAFLLIWEFLVRFGLGGIIPAPTAVFKTFVIKLMDKKPDGSTLITNILVSLQVACTGLFFAIFIGVPLGWLMGWYQLVDRFVRPIFELVRPIPPISWIPLTILWMGIGLKAKAMIIFLASFIPCLINSYTGIKQTNKTMINVAKTFGASNFKVFLTVAIPSSMPLTFTGMRIALNSAWSTLVAAELLAANAGVGYMISMGRSFARIDIILVGMVTIGIMGFTFSWIFRKVEDIIVKWRTV